MENRIKSQPFRTVLTISMGFLVVYLITHWMWTIWLALLIGLCGVFSTYLSRKIEWFWFRLSWILSLIVPKILLTVIFYIILFPVAQLRKLFWREGPIQLKKQSGSMFREVDKTYEAGDLENPW